MLGPDATGVGWVFEYALVDESGKHDLPGAAHAAGLEPALRPRERARRRRGRLRRRLRASSTRSISTRTSCSPSACPLREVVHAVRESNQEVGGRVLELAGHEYMVRGRGYVKKQAGSRARAAEGRAPTGAPVCVRDVGEVKLGPAPRRGLAELDGRRRGGRRHRRHALRRERAARHRRGEGAPGASCRRRCRQGVEVVATYDRSELIEASIDTLRHTLIEEMLVVSLVIFVFLLHARSALVPILTLPLAVLLAFMPMFYQGLTVNIMSLGRHRRGHRRHGRRLDHHHRERPQEARGLGGRPAAAATDCRC